jgi:hypothetical protein
MTGPGHSRDEQMLLPFMFAPPRLTTPDLDRVRRRGGAPIEVKRAIFLSRRLHRKGQHLQAWHLLMALPVEYDDYRELIEERLLIASWVKPLDRSQTCRWAKWIVSADPSKAKGVIEGKRGQAYNLNITVSELLVPDGRGNWHISPKCYTRPTFIHHICRSFYSSLPWGHLRLRLRFKLMCPPAPFLSLPKSPQACLIRIRHHPARSHDRR